MARANTQPLRLFYSYSRADEGLRDELNNHLAVLKNKGLIAPWHDRRIPVGCDWDRKLREQLDAADIILLLVSADFLASSYCNEIEIKRSMERHKANEACVIPVILRPCNWHEAPFGKLQPVPKDGNPITECRSHDRGFSEVTESIGAIVEEIAEFATQTPPTVLGSARISDPSHSELHAAVDDLFDHFKVAFDKAISEDSKRALQRHRDAYKALFTDAYRFESMPSLRNLQADQETPVVSLSFCSRTLNKTFSYDLRCDVTAGEFAAALANEHFPKETKGHEITWLISDAEGTPLSAALTVDEVRKTLGKVVFLAGVHPVALYSPSRIVLGHSRLVRKISEFGRLRLLRRANELDANSWRQRLTKYQSRLNDASWWIFRNRVAIKLNDLAWTCAENNVNIDLASQMVDIISRIQGEKLNPNFADTAAWVYYRQGRYRNAQSLVLNVMDVCPKAGYLARVICRYHLYFIHRKLDECLIASKVRDALLVDTHATFGTEYHDIYSDLACRRVLADDDALQWWRDDE